MPRKRRSSPISTDERPSKKRRLAAAEEEKQDETDTDIEMSSSNGPVSNNTSLATSPRRRRASLANIGGLIEGGVVGGDFEPQFQRGAIRSVAVKNWVTFDDAKIDAVPGLNLIMGPNGTGKSSLICAICMGLNGKTQTLGRVDRIGDFIKRGENRASIEIVLHGGRGKPDVSITRIVTRSASKWKIGRKSSNGTEVTKLVKSMNIKVDNLCQFLAQDRVVEFARLSPQNLLLETERAVGDEQDDLLGSHEQLIELQKDLMDLEQEMKTVEASLAASQEELKGLESVIANFRSREDMRVRVEVFESRLAWKSVEEAREEEKELKVTVNQVKQQMRDEEKELRPLKNKMTSWQRKETKLKTETTKLAKENGLMSKKLKRVEKRYEDLTEKMSEQRNEIKELKKRAAEQEKKREKLEKELEKLEESLRNLGDTSEAQANLKRIKEEKKMIHSDKRKFRVRQEQLKRSRDRCENEAADLMHRIKQLANTEARRNEAVYRGNRRKFRRFTNWVEHHRHEFDGQVWGPIVAHMEVKDKLHAHYLNTAIRQDILYAWVVTDRNDWSKLSREGKSQGLNPVVVLSEGDSLESYTRNRPCNVDVLRRNGASGYLDECFEAPEVIKCVLCSSASLHQLAYADEELSTESRQNLLCQRQNQPNTVMRLFVPTESWRVTISRYGERDAATSSQPIRRIREGDPGLSVSQDVTEEINRARAQHEENLRMIRDVDRQRKQCNDEEAPLTRRFQELSNEEQEWRKVEKEHKKLRNKIQRTEGKLREVAEPIDVEREEAGVRKKIRKMCTDQVKALEFIVRANHELVELQKRFRRMQVQRDHAVLEKECAKTRHDQLSKRQKSLGVRLKSANAALKKASAKAEDLEAQGRRTYPLRRWEKAWTEEHLSKSIADLEAAIEDLRSRIACVLCNPADVARYQKLEKQVAQFSKQMEESTDATRRFEERMKEVEENWKPKIREMVTKISGRFSELFGALHAVGEVRLGEAELFGEWAIEIMTDFRPQTGEGLQALSGYRQSGGERSVSTMLYLLSLQEVTTAPFRVVDEINQGMDPNNERLIMDILNQECVPRHNREIPQYFVVTPKLLPRLQYSAHSAAFMIFNGPWVAPQADWKVDAFLQSQMSEAGDD